MPSSPSTLESHLGYWLRCLSNFVSHRFAARLEAEGVSVAGWVVLRTLHDAPGMSLNEAATAVGVDKSSLSRMVERLVQRGLVVRAQGSAPGGAPGKRGGKDKLGNGHGEDRRSVQLSLTRQGKALVPKLARIADENDRACFGSLSKPKKQELLATIRHLLDANGWDAATRGEDRTQ